MQEATELLPRTYAKTDESPRTAHLSRVKYFHHSSTRRTQ